jgi:chromosome partitioning protein
MSAQTIAICNRKGGVAKTTTTWALAFGLLNKGKKVLAIDLDPQDANLSTVLGADKENLQGAYELLNSPDQNIKDCIQSINAGLDLVVADNTLANVVIEAFNPEALCRLSDALETIKKNYDYILIDTPPTKSALTANAYIAADEIIIPSEADYLAVKGICELVDSILATTKHMNPNLKIGGIIIEKYRPGTKIQKEMSTMCESLGDALNTYVFKTQIRQSVKVQEAQRNQKSIYEYAPHASVTNDFIAFVDEFLSREID